MKPYGIAEKLYCDRCDQASRPDGCRVSVTQSGLTALVHVECRCRILERKGSVN
jgi:hypothetical protein